MSTPSTLPSDSGFVSIQVEDSSLFLPWLAVLASQRIAYQVEYQDGVPCLLVAEAELPRVRREFELYEQNTAAWRESHLFNETETLVFSWSNFWTALISFAFLLRFHQYVQEAVIDWQARGVWNAALIRKGEYWRCLTALTLHGDYAHLLGNLFWGCMLLTIAASEFGNGAALLMMLAAGCLGNALNAWLLPLAQYQALGASTMVFGLLGMLAGASTLKIQRRRLAGRGILQQFRLWLPLLAGFAMLSLTGTAPGSDLAGHFNGFLCGILLGVLKNLRPQKISSLRWQLLFAAIAILLPPLAWFRAWKI